MKRWNKTSLAAAALCKTSERLLDFKLVFMKVIMLSTDAAIDDKILKHIAYTQALHAVRNYLPVTEYEAIELASFQVVSEHSDGAPENGFLAADILHYIPARLAYNYKTDEEIFTLECAILMRATTLKNNQIDEDTAKDLYLQMARKSPLFGSMFYECDLVSAYEDLPDSVFLAVNEWGVHLMDRGTKEHLLTIDYYDIKKWSCSSVQLTLCVGEAETRLVCRMPSGKPKEATNVMKVYVSIQASKPQDGGGGGELL